MICARSQIGAMIKGPGLELEMRAQPLDDAGMMRASELPQQQIELPLILDPCRHPPRLHLRSQGNVFLHAGPPER